MTIFSIIIILIDITITSIKNIAVSASKILIGSNSHKNNLWHVNLTRKKSFKTYP